MRNMVMKFLRIYLTNSNKKVGVLDKKVILKLNYTEIVKDKELL